MILDATPFPRFIPNQLLRAQQLNDLVSFLDDSSRLTRVFSLGIGIVYGLDIECVEPTVDNKLGGRTIRMTSGLGLSSDGFLFRVPSDCEFDQYAEVEISEKAFDCVTQDQRFTNNDKLTFYELNETEKIPLGQEDLYQPLDDFPGGKAALNDLVVVLLWARKESDQAICFNECDEQQQSFSIVRVLLVEKDFIKGKIKEPAVDDDDDDDSETIIADKTPSIQRLIWKNFENGQQQVQAAHSFEGLKEAYIKLCEEVRLDIADAYTAIQPGILGVNLDKLKILQNRLAEIIQQVDSGTAPLQKIQVQYIYDYLKDLVVAYYEFTASLANLQSTGTLVPDPCQHPGFISMGTLGGNVECKTPFQATALEEKRGGNIRKAIFLLRRLVALCEHFKLEAFPTKFFRITASHRRDNGLSNRAIPFYYDPQIQDKWNFESHTLNQSNRIPTYHRTNIDPPFNEHLDYDTDAYHFYRIEGHVGLTLEDAVKKIEEERWCRNLPFDVKCVEIDSKSDVEPIQNKAGWMFTHLELLYQSTLCDMRELLGPNGQFQIDKFPQELKDCVGNDLPIITAPDNQQALNCYLDLIRKLCNEYEKFTRKELLKSFIEKHPGTEHLGGVPRGGTFIVAYEESDTEDDNGNFTKQVVADFCLPYYCCDGLPPTSVIIEPFIFIFPKTYCREDQEEYEILVYPSGGVVEGSLATGNYIIEENGKYFFQPSGVPGSNEVTIDLTYQVNGLTATTQVELVKFEVKQDEINIKPGNFIYDPDKNCDLIGQEYEVSYGGTGMVTAWRLNGSTQGAGNAISVVVPITQEPSKVEVAVRNNDGCVGQAGREIFACEFIEQIFEVGDGIGQWDPQKRVYIVPFAKPPGTLRFEINPSIVPLLVEVPDGLNPADVMKNYFEIIGSDCAQRAFQFNYGRGNSDQDPLNPGEYLFFVENRCGQKLELRVIIEDDGFTDDDDDTGLVVRPTEETETTVIKDSALINKRQIVHQAAVNAISEDKDSMLITENSFARVFSFLKSPNMEVAIQHKEVMNIVSSLTRQFSAASASAKKKAQISNLLNDVLASYLDRQTIGSTFGQDLSAAEKEKPKVKKAMAEAETQFSIAKEVVGKTVAKLKSDKVLTPAKIKKRWNAKELKEAIEAPAIDAFTKLIK